MVCLRYGRCVGALKVFVLFSQFLFILTIGIIAGKDNRSSFSDLVQSLSSSGRKKRTVIMSGLALTAATVA